MSMDRFKNTYPPEFINCAGCNGKFEDGELTEAGYCQDCAAEKAELKRQREEQKEEGQSDA